jgi:hypothetical protein
MALNLIQTNAYEVTPVLAMNNQTGTSYTTVLADAINTLITVTNASTCTVTIPPNSSVPYPVGAVINLSRLGTGAVNLAQGAGVTIVSSGAVPSAPGLRVRYSTVSLVQTSANTWLAFGDAS